jgi:arylsulfatase A-like enzyme
VIRRANSDSPQTIGGAGDLRLFLACGFAWAAACFALLALRLAPAERWSQTLVLGFLACFLALGHAAAATLLRRCGAFLLRAHRWRRGYDAISALVAGALYAGMALSLVKYTYARAHLRREDIWFILGSLRQLGSEGSPRERLLLAACFLLPLLFGLLIYAGMRRARRDLRPLRWRSLLALAVVAFCGLALICWRYPSARFAVHNILPETHAVAQAIERIHKGEAAGSAGRFTPDPTRSARIESLPTPANLRRDNVVVLMLESVPWSRLFGPLARPEATPRINALAAESIVFDRAYATATHSDYAQTSILAALHPRKFPRHDYFVDLAYPRTLIWDLLRPAGYRTAMFSCQNEGWGNMKAFLRTPGLEVFRHSPDWPDAPRRGEGAESKVFEPTPITAFTTWLGESKSSPFLAYLNFQATHYPYVSAPGTVPLYEPEAIDFPTTFLSFPAEKIPVMENRFYNALHAVDIAVGAVVDALQAAGVWERTILLVVSDHGEAFYEHGVPTHGTMLLEEQIRTAAFLRLPETPARVVTEPVSVLDLVPALAGHLGYPPHGNVQGRSDILDPGYSGRGRAFLLTIQGITHEDGLLVDDKKLIRNHDRRELALFDLATDPGERANLSATAPETRAALERRLDQLLGLQLGYYADRGWESGWYPPKLP